MRASWSGYRGTLLPAALAVRGAGTVYKADLAILGSLGGHWVGQRAGERHALGLLQGWEGRSSEELYASPGTVNDFIDQYRGNGPVCRPRDGTKNVCGRQLKNDDPISERSRSTECS